MGLSFYPRLKALAFILAITALFLSVLVCIGPQEAGARANQTAYMTAPPNTWELKGFNVSGTAPWFIIQTLGWNKTNMLGNVGIGNGSLSALNATGNRVINYTETNFMAGDVSTAPIDPARLTTVSISGAEVEPGYASNISVEEFESETGREVQDNATEGSARFLNLGGDADEDIPLNDPYHSILLGRPVDDMFYQHPHGIATNAYGRLVGLPLPGGAFANIGMRCLGYGY
jgi:hypothetical protein